MEEASPQKVEGVSDEIWARYDPSNSNKLPKTSAKDFVQATIASGDGDDFGDEAWDEAFEKFEEGGS
ncbi:hypothetical protein TrLO_g522 [Triparma laevis f. longispina]|uniref:Uncharacterized protein n=1 Tax=Triparma laevis f. longispina TaxID=1714387 RepID=A0A9W7FI20_9STRA|nr:hypothetical protein TrLO_g522 [Triparma laevis f. longispina]